MTCPTAPIRLLANAPARLAAALAKYPAHYDDVLQDVHSRLLSAGHATKLDLGVLIAWKHVRNARWMKTLLKLPPGDVETITAAAFTAGVSDADRIEALDGLPGFGSGGAFTSVLLAAWKPTEFGVFDQNAGLDNWPKAVTAACKCNQQQLPVYFDHLRQIAGEMTVATRQAWTPRKVDMALLNL